MKNILKVLVTVILMTGCATTLTHNQSRIIRELIAVAYLQGYQSAVIDYDKNGKFKTGIQAQYRGKEVADEYMKEFYNQ